MLCFLLFGIILTRAFHLPKAKAPTLTTSSTIRFCRATQQFGTGLLAVQAPPQLLTEQAAGQFI